jgi:hypothetical protein
LRDHRREVGPLDTCRHAESIVEYGGRDEELVVPPDGIRRFEGDDRVGSNQAIGLRSEPYRHVAGLEHGHGRVTKRKSRQGDLGQLQKLPQR